MRITGICFYYTSYDPFIGIGPDGMVQKMINIQYNYMKKDRIVGMVPTDQ